MFLLANLVHYWSPDENRQLLLRVRRAAEAGARLLIADVYSVEEIDDWLAATGWPSRTPHWPAPSAS